jgi:hypothetical protein
MGRWDSLHNGLYSRTEEMGVPGGANIRNRVWSGAVHLSNYVTHQNEPEKKLGSLTNRATTPCHTTADSVTSLSVQVVV